MARRNKPGLRRRLARLERSGLWWVSYTAGKSTAVPRLAVEPGVQLTLFRREHRASATMAT